MPIQEAIRPEHPNSLHNGTTTYKHLKDKNMVHFIMKLSLMVIIQLHLP